MNFSTQWGVKRPSWIQILWVARQSKRDVIFDASSLVSSITSTIVQTIHEANRIVCKLKSKRLTVDFSHLGRDIALKMIMFSDWKSVRCCYSRRTFDYSDGGDWKSLTPVLAVTNIQDGGGIDSAVIHATLFSELMFDNAEHHLWLSVSQIIRDDDALKCTKCFLKHTELKRFCGKKQEKVSSLTEMRTKSDIPDKKCSFWKYRMEHGAVRVFVSWCYNDGIRVFLSWALLVHHFIVNKTSLKNQHL